MRIDRSHLPWAAVAAGVATLAALAYAVNTSVLPLPSGLHFPSLLGPIPPARIPYGGTPLGLIFGLLAFGFFLFAAVLGVLKKKRLWPLGSVQTWLKAHLWLTVLTVPLIVLHSGFRVGGPHTAWLLALYTLVMASGVLGIILQHFLPSVMRESLPREVVFEQIPHLRASLLEAATHMRAEVAEAEALGVDGEVSPGILRRFLDESCLPFLALKSPKGQHLASPQGAAEMFKALRSNVHPEWRVRVSKMEDWCESRRLMDLQTKFQHWLHGWLLIHVPSSIALILVTAWHAWVGLRFLVSQPI
jgi:hypothetical protein